MIIPLDTNTLERLTKTELEIIQFINSHEEELPELSIVDIAFETYSSPSPCPGPFANAGLTGSMN